MSVTKIASGIKGGSAVCGLPDGSFVVASGQGLLTHHDATGAEIESLSLGWVVSGLAAHPTGSGVFAACAATGVWEVLFGGTPSARKLKSLKGARGLAVDVASASIHVVATRDGGTYGRIPITGTGKGRVVARGVGNARALARRMGDPSAWVLRVGGTTGAAPSESSLAGYDATSGAAGPVLPDLGLARDVAWVAPAGTQLALADSRGRILLVDTQRPGAAPVVIEDGLPRVWSVDLSATPGPGGGAALIAGIGDALVLVDLPPAPRVQLEMPAKPLYLSSWARVGVALTGALSLDDLIFRVEPPEGGLVSQSRDATFAHRPSVVLAASAVPGAYKLVVHDRATGDELLGEPFEITDAWDGVDGPPVSHVGTVGVDSPDPAWGGGDPFVPQNLGVTPALGTKNVAVVIVETNDSTALSAADQGALRTEWLNEVFDGVTRDGVVESSRGYWRDVSEGRLDLSNAGIVGPIRLADNWASYGTTINTMTGKTDGWEGFARAAIADLRAQNEAAAAAGNPPIVDLMTVDSIVLVVRSLPASGTNPGRFVWPSATRPGAYQLSFEVGRQRVSVPVPFGSVEISVPIMRTIQMFSMPHDWEPRESSGRVRGETVSHELGHNLGLPDEYARSAHPQWAKDRDLASTTAAGASWSLMSWEEEFPQTTVVEKMRLGWVDAPHVRNLSFATLGPVDETVTLHASDLGPPPAGRFSAVEVRIADGHNYYFEYRRELPSSTSDQDVPADRTVIGVDCRSGSEPTDRRNILRIKNDSDNDNGEFQSGDDYREQDSSDPGYPNDFRMSVVSTSADSAQVRIQYGDSKPDPQIRPWAPSTNWKSPDLRVTNARNAADSRYRDLPWEGHDNRIVATVRNPGLLNARSVRVDFFVKDFTLGSGAETPLGSDTHDVPTGATVEFTSSVAWVPPPLSAIPFLGIRPHYCVVARIAEYADPVDPSIREITRDNNEAQSNHTQLISVSASPSSREIGFVKVTNPLPAAADCRVQVRQTSEYARTYVEHAWVHLQPGEERDVMFLTESLIGDPLLGHEALERRERIYKEPNSVRLTGIADDHETCEGFVTGGAHVLVRSARATRWVKFARQGGHAFGRVEVVDDRSGAEGTVLVTVWPEGAPEKAIVREGRAVDGEVNVELGDVEDDWLAQGHYLGGFDVAPSDSEVFRR